jgi:glycosyltransferase involved in cell wall biosynthesis
MSHNYTLVIDATAVHPRSGGAGSYLRAVVLHLAKAGSPPILIARTNDTEPWTGAAAVHRIAPSPRPLRLLWEQVGLAQAVNRIVPNGPVVLHSPHYTTPIWLPRRIRRVVTIHDLTFFTRPLDHSPVKRTFFRRAIVASAKRADSIVVVSETTGRMYSEITGRTDRVVCAPHGVDSERFKPAMVLASDERTVEAELLRGLGCVSPMIVSLGTIEPRKNIPALLRAYELVRRQEPAVTLVLAGQQWPGVRLPDPQPGELRLGFVPDDVATALLRSAAVVAYPSSEEGFGMPLIEAMACGTPVVAARSAVSLEVCGDAADLVDLTPEASFDKRLATALITALGKNERPHRRGVERARSFTWERSAELHLAAFEQAAVGP